MQVFKALKRYSGLLCRPAIAAALQDELQAVVQQIDLYLDSIQSSFESRAQVCLQQILTLCEHTPFSTCHHVSTSHVCMSHKIIHQACTQLGFHGDPDKPMIAELLLNFALLIDRTTVIYRNCQQQGAQASICQALWTISCGLCNANRRLNRVWQPYEVLQVNLNSLCGTKRAFHCRKMLRQCTSWCAQLLCKMAAD